MALFETNAGGGCVFLSSAKIYLHANIGVRSANNKYQKNVCGEFD